MPWKNLKNKMQSITMKKENTMIYLYSKKLKKKKKRQNKSTLGGLTSFYGAKILFLSQESGDPEKAIRYGQCYK